MKLTKAKKYEMPEWKPTLLSTKARQQFLENLKERSSYEYTKECCREAYREGALYQVETGYCHGTIWEMDARDLCLDFQQYVEASIGRLKFRDKEQQKAAALRLIETCKQVLKEDK